MKSLSTLSTRDFPGGSDGKESAYNREDPGLIPGSGRFPREGNANPSIAKGMATLVFLPGESHGQRSQAGYSPWGRKESDTTDQVTLSLHPTLLI